MESIVEIESSDVCTICGGVLLHLTVEANPKTLPKTKPTRCSTCNNKSTIDIK